MQHKANLGCGPFPLYPQDAKYMNIDPKQSLAETLKDWLLVDLYIQGPGITNWDMETLKEIPDNYLTEIFSSHALEHVSHIHVIDVLKTWHLKLGSAGKLTIIVPDLLYAFRQLRTMENDQLPGGLYSDPFGLHSPLSIIYGTHSQPGEYHLGGFTECLLRYALEHAGFNAIEIRKEFDAHEMSSLIALAYA